MARYPEQCSTVFEASDGGYAIKISCKACKHERVVKAQAVIDLYRAKHIPSPNLIVVGNRMKCAKCGEKYPEVTATNGPIDGQALG